MSYRISKTKTVTNTYEVVQTGKFQTYGHIRKIRGKAFGDEKMQGMTHCLNCNKKFKDEDMTWIAIIKHGKNKLFCEECGLKIEKDLQTN